MKLKDWEVDVIALSLAYLGIFLLTIDGLNGFKYTNAIIDFMKSFG